MNTHRLGWTGLVLSLVVPMAGATALGADTSAEPGVEPLAAPHIWLKGPFGTVLGSDPARPAGAGPGDVPLDLWMRSAPLLLGADIPLQDLTVVSVVARTQDGAAPPERLSTSATEFDGPDTTGVIIITATVQTDRYGSSEHAWLVDVPDREGDPTALFDIPGPRVQLVSDAGSIDGEQGHGCYVYMCQEAGYRPPTKALEALPLSVGEAPSLRVDDGSAIVAWKGTLEPVGSTRSERILAHGDPDEPVSTAELVGLEPTVAGEWLLELLVEYDRERGWQWFLYRLASE